VTSPTGVQSLLVPVNQSKTGNVQFLRRFLLKLSLHHRVRSMTIRGHHCYYSSYYSADQKLIRYCLLSRTGYQSKLDASRTCHPVGLGPSPDWCQSGWYPVNWHCCIPNSSTHYLTFSHDRESFFVQNDLHVYQHAASRT
jgi:hypothetical protein